VAKSLLLGGAAGLVAVAGAQAADLPVKAKPVEYVKVCSLYGEGFFYIPGTDTCLKIGGLVRYDQYFGPTGGSGAPHIVGGAARNDSFDSPDYATRARTVVSFDARTQTEYGTLRSYAAISPPNRRRSSDR
jgi:Porin subfamily